MITDHIWAIEQLSLDASAKPSVADPALCSLAGEATSITAKDGHKPSNI